MIEIAKPSRKELKGIWNKINDKNSTFKSLMKPRYNLSENRLEWYFRYHPTYEIDQESRDKLTRLEFLVEDWQSVIEMLKTK